MNYKLGLSSIALLGSFAMATEVSAAASHTVKSGDTLYGISRTYNLSVADLKSLNHLTSDNIFIGQKLVTTKSVATTSNNTVATVKTTVTDSSSIVKAVNADLLNVRSGAGTSYKILGTVSKNTQVSVISTTNGWSKISFKNSYGYVSSTYLSDVKVATVNKTTTSTSTTTANKSTVSTIQQTYTVKSGDTLYRVAATNSISVDELKKLNNLSSNTIFVGQKLIVKAGTVPAKTETNVSNNGYVATYGLFIQPTEGILTSPFGYRIHPITNAYSLHTGIDIAKSGIVNVNAAADGTVIRSGVTNGYGQYVVISHNINGKEYATLYAHVRENSRVVSVGDKVKAGQKLALMGSTGDSTGQHTHFEIHEGAYQATNTKVVDPLTYIKLK